MSVGVNVEKLEENKVALHIEVDAAQVDETINRTLNKFNKDVRVQGFRQGHAPKHILRRFVGEENVLRNAVETLIPVAYQEALEKSQLEVITEPELSDMSELAEGKPFTFKLSLQVKPDMELGEYKGLELAKRDVPVTEEMIAEQLNAMREQQAMLVPVEDRGLQTGDMVEVALEAECEGKKIYEGGQDPFFIEVGKGMILAELEEKIAGMKKGEEKQVDVTYPEDFANKELAGKKASFKVNVKEIKEKKLAELNDEFAKTYKVENVQQLKDEVKKHMESERDRRIQDDLRVQAAEAVLGIAKLNTPPVLVQKETRRILDQLHRNLESYGVDPHEHFTEHGPDEKLKDEQRQKEVEQTAEKKARLNLILDAIVKKENILVSFDEVNKEIRLIAQGSGQTEQKVRGFLESQGAIYSLQQSLAREKAIDFLVKHATIKEEEKETAKS